MSNANDSKKLLDNGWTITLFRNGLGSYTARATKSGKRFVDTDDFTPVDALHRIIEKVTTGTIVGDEHRESSE